MPKRKSPLDLLTKHDTTVSTNNSAFESLNGDRTEDDEGLEERVLGDSFDSSGLVDGSDEDSDGRSDGEGDNDGKGGSEGRSDGGGSEGEGQGEGEEGEGSDSEGHLSDSDRDEGTGAFTYEGEGDTRSVGQEWSERRRRVSIDSFDSSDEEDLRNTIGNIPVSWYDETEHIGYDWEGRPIEKPLQKSEIDQFLQRIEDPDYWRKVRDNQTGRDIVLTDDQISSLTNVQRGRYPTIGYNPYQPFLDFVSGETELHPLSNRPEDKRSFLPSVHERRQVGRMVHAIKMGWAKPRRPIPSEDELASTRFYDLWSTENTEAKSKNEMARMKMHFPAPKVGLPGHEESYNPPTEYLLTEEERKKWEEMDPEDRRRNFIPHKYPSIRQIPAYPTFINERFDRCLDLYLAPRMRKNKLNVDMKDLLPELPKPQDLQPFPTTLALMFTGHTDMVRSVSMEPRVGQLVVSGGDDGTVRVWEVGTGRCLRTMQLQSCVTSVAWCPDSKMTLVACVAATQLFVLNVDCGDGLVAANTDAVLKALCDNSDLLNAAQGPVTWSLVEELPGSSASIIHLKLSFETDIKQVVWHAKGDYFATVTSNGAKSVVVHQLSKLKSQAPFQKNKGTVQCVAFHPSRPLFFVATQQHVRVYNLAKLQLVKKLQSNCRWISSMCIHPKGDNLIIGGYDCRLSWFDLDLSPRPYKTFRHHKGAIRTVAFHRHYPLFASASDDGSVMVYHGRVYSDLLQNAQLVPVKMLRGHGTVEGLSVLSCVFHPTQPWLVTAAADHTLALYTY